MSEIDRKKILAETIADWLVLTESSHFVISRSGFGEMASTFTAFQLPQPATYRLPLGFDENCNFEEGFSIKSKSIEQWKPPNENNIEMPLKYSQR